MFTILHISDLHRSPTHPISNDELLSTLIADRDRQVRENPSISEVDAIIVSGDIIQGVTLGYNGYTEELRRQYDEALKFISELTERFVNGDRSRVILVPGNHDVDWNTACTAMTTVDEKEGSFPSDLRYQLSRQGSLFRWDWKDKKLYRVNDQETYEKRFDRFWEFFTKFYENESQLLLSSPENYFNLHELCEGRIAVAAFNSCFENDCFSHEGTIPERAIAKSHLALQDLGKNYDLKIAVWHHNIEGPPQQTDYMDIDLVRRMIDKGFRLGLHGHQHRADAEPHYIRLPIRETMVVVSAGSLCAGPSDLPPGVNRQYNIIEIADDFQSARVHVREMTVATAFGQSLLASLGGKSFIDMDWTPEKSLVGEPIDTSRSQILSVIGEAEKAFFSRAYDDVVQFLNPYRESLPAYGHRLLVEALKKAERWQELILCMPAPASPDELTILVHAYAQTEQWEQARDILDKSAEAVGLPEPGVKQLTEWLNAQEEIKRWPPT